MLCRVSVRSWRLDMAIARRTEVQASEVPVPGDQESEKRLMELKRKRQQLMEAEEDELLQGSA